MQHSIEESSTEFNFDLSQFHWGEPLDSNLELDKIKKILNEKNLLNLNAEEKHQLNSSIKQLRESICNFNYQECLEIHNLIKFIETFVGKHNEITDTFDLPIDEELGLNWDHAAQQDIKKYLREDLFPNKSQLLNESLFINGRTKYCNKENLIFSSLGLLVGVGGTVAIVLANAPWLFLVLTSLLILKCVKDLAVYAYFSQDKKSLSKNDVDFVQHMVRP
jgi:hypothetical protein